MLRIYRRDLELIVLTYEMSGVIILIFIGVCKGPFINYVRVPREGGLEKSLHTLTLRGRGQTHSYVIFFRSIFYIRNRAVKWFGKNISFI